MESSSSKVRFSLLPYSAAQQPVQCRLQAEVGSSRMAQGILQPSRAAVSSCVALPKRLALSTKLRKNALRTPGSSAYSLSMSWYQLPFSAMALRTPARWEAYQFSGMTRSTSAMSLGRLASGSFSRYASPWLMMAASAACLTFPVKSMVMTSFHW